MKLVLNLNLLTLHRRQFSFKRLLTWYSDLHKSKPSNPPYKHIIQIGDPRLRAASDVVPYEDIETEEIQRLIVRLKNTLKRYNCVGLSATQIGVPLRIFVMEINEKSIQDFKPAEQAVKQISLIKPTVVINPAVKITDYKKIMFSESCGSVRGFYADVGRYYALQLKGLNEYGEPLKLDASGFTARIIQHEMDHLDGKLYTDIMDRKTLSCSCWEVVNQRNGKVELPYGPY